MHLIAIKDISPMLPAGSVFEQASDCDGQLLIAMGVAARHEPVAPAPDGPATVTATQNATDTPADTHAETAPAPRGRRSYRTRAMQADA